MIHITYAALSQDIHKDLLNNTHNLNPQRIKLLAKRLHDQTGYDNLLCLSVVAGLLLPF